MKKIFLLLFSLALGLAYAQTGRIAKKVEEFTFSKQTVKEYQLFSKSLAQKTSKYLTSATDVTVLDLNAGALNQIVQEAPELLSISVPYLDENIEVTLYKKEVVTPDFQAYTESGELIDYTPGQYYRGTVTDDSGSLAAISFFNDEVIGVISTWEHGNIVLGKSTDGQDYLTYSDVNMLGENPFVCGFDDLVENQLAQSQISFDPAMESVTETEKCVRIYYEIANRPYFLRGSDLENTLDWITGIQNNIGTLYDNDGIDVSISSIRVWTFQDPYTGNYSENLNKFQNTVKDFDADIGHLVNTPMTTSVAFLDSLCTPFNHAYSGISMNYAEVPSYSWTIMAMTHEMGHGFGSPHTHSCVWNGNNTQIDGCGSQAGAGDPGCSGGPIPQDGGTIMSYCHLIGGVGINFLNGFGPQPSALIRNTIDSKDCVGSDCSAEATICVNSLQEAVVTELPNGDIQVSLTDDYSELWAYQMVSFGWDPEEDEWVYVETKDFIITDYPQSGYYDLYIRNVCEGGVFGGSKKSFVLAGDFCDNTLFTDTGGVNGRYKDNQHIIKTFYPSVDGGKVGLNILKYNIHSSDFIYVYDGDSVESPLFEGGTLNGNVDPGPEFISTHSSGAITFEFISDPFIVRDGWEAEVNCDRMSTSDLAERNGIKLYPNPVKDILTIVSDKSIIKSVRLIDTTGRSLSNQKLNAQSGSLEMSRFAPGVYLIGIELKDGVIYQKIIKK